VPLLTGGAPRTAAYLAGASLALSILVVGVTAAIRCRSLADEHRRRHRFHFLRWPWELLLLAGAALAWQVMSGTTAIQDNNAGVVVHVPARLLVVPLMVIIGAAAFAGRITVVWLRRRTRRAAPRSNALYIGLQRIAREAAIVVVLAAATATPIALAAYGGTVTRSVKASVDAEAGLHVGADVVINVPVNTAIPPALAPHATSVFRVSQLIISGVQTDLLGVDPRTFAQGAYWDGQINGETMNQMIAALRAPPAAGTPYPAIGSAGTPTGDQTVRYLSQPPVQYHIRDVPVLPAVRGGYPLMLVPAGSFPFSPDNPAVAHQIWVRGDPVEIRAELARANLPISWIESSDDLFVDTLYDPLTFTFEYLTALSLLGGLVTMVGLLLYLEARTPRHRRSYVMFRRMGLRPRTHRTALLIELGVPLVAGLVGGLALAAGLAKALSGNFDVDVAVPPGTIVSIPVQVITAISVGVLVLATVAASYAQLRIGRANPSEVLRDTV
jgi:putative ABC transport system permease protein